MTAHLPFPPKDPAGPFQQQWITFCEEGHQQFVRLLSEAPRRLRLAVGDLNDEQLDTLYRNWSIRQIVHHLADSHVHSYIRFKWALTEDHPTIKAYEEGDWVQLEDARVGNIEPALALLDGLHHKWTQLLSLMTRDQFGRTFLHPQTKETVSLWSALNYYTWHARHHTAQILWLRERHGW